MEPNNSKNTQHKLGVAFSYLERNKLRLLFKTAPRKFHKTKLVQECFNESSTSPSLRSWWDSCARGTFLAAEPPCEVRGEAARVNPACRISYEFWMPPTFGTLFGTIWLTQSWRVVQHETDLQTSQAKRNNQVTNKTTICWKLFRIQAGFCSYSKLEKQSPLLSRNKKLQKEVKEFPKMLQRSNSDRDKNHRKSMLECTGNTSASWTLDRQR